MPTRIKKNKADCNCKTEQQIEGIMDVMGPEFKASHIKKFGKYSYYKSAIASHAVAYALIPFITVYLIYSAFLKKNRQVTLVNKIMDIFRHYNE